MGDKEPRLPRLMVVSPPCSAGFDVTDRRCTTSFDGVSNNDSFRRLAATLNFSPFPRIPRLSIPEYFNLSLSSPINFIFSFFLIY